MKSKEENIKIIKERLLQIMTIKYYSIPVIYPNHVPLPTINNFKRYYNYPYPGMLEIRDVSKYRMNRLLNLVEKYAEDNWTPDIKKIK